MNSSRINRLLKRANNIKTVHSDTSLVVTGVHYVDQNGDIIEGSGPTMRVPRQAAGRYGVLAVPAPIVKEDWAAAYNRCEDYQSRLAEAENARDLPPEAREFLERHGGEPQDKSPGAA